MTHAYDDLDHLDDLDRVWYQEGSSDVDRDVEVDFDLGEAIVFDDDPVVESIIDGQPLGTGTGAIDGMDELDDDDVFALHGRDRRRAGRVSRRKTTTLLQASTMVIGVGVGVGVGIGLIGVMLGTLCTTRDSRLKERVRKLSTASMAVVAWLASLTGTWFVYAGYRVHAPAGADLSMYPRQYLLRSPHLRFWETFAMEWKMHVGWITPFLATAVAFVAVLGSLVNVATPDDFMHRAYHP
jgi:hypothetical protein